MDTTSPHILKDELRTLAHEAGLPLFGVCPPVYPEAAQRAFAHWIAAGRHAEMSYLAQRRDIREGLATLLPGLRSLLVVGYPYGAARDPGAPRPPKGRPYGRLSLYAQGRDYHRVLESALKPLLARLRGLGAQVKWAVDYGPFCERTLGQLAGLGFLGRNGCLIHPTYGSYFHLAVVATDLALTPDEPLAHPGCGDCRRCIKACPSGALGSDGQVDCRLCLSYHTIENKGELPPAVAARLGSAPDRLRPVPARLPLQSSLRSPLGAPGPPARLAVLRRAAGPIRAGIPGALCGHRPDASRLRRHLAHGTTDRRSVFC